MKSINDNMEQLRCSLDEQMNEIRRKNEEFMNRYSQPYGTDAHEDSHDEEEQMYCAECGARIEMEAQFCPMCGNKLSDAGNATYAGNVMEY